ncbi:2-oxo acid dehydrogenase subunit E2 [Niveispirillum fermenti]|uniref:2-oxo acid dehydrogenase subunit E2 n=1 Tax=Niveispirillum fermenti TaxID=1233113 RepID=UPI003A8BDA43
MTPAASTLPVPSASASLSPSPSPSLSSIALKGVRGVIAARMMDSLHHSAQLTYHAEADISALLDQRREWKQAGLKISVEDCVIHALARVLAAFPAFNGVLEDGLFTPSAGLDLSVAITTPGGLMTPVLRGASTLSLAGIAAARADLVARAQAGKLAVSQMRGGSFTLSNLGTTRVRFFTPILNRPQVALLGLGRVDPVLVPDGAGGGRTVQRLGLSLTADHRLLDGYPCGQFLEGLCHAVERFEAAV